MKPSIFWRWKLDTYIFFKSWGIFRCLFPWLLCKSYCWWLTSQTTTWDVWNPKNNGKNYQPQLVQDFSHQQYVAQVLSGSDIPFHIFSDTLPVVLELVGWWRSNFGRGVRSAVVVCQSQILTEFPSCVANYNDRLPPVGHLKWWFSKGIPPKSPVKELYQFAQIAGWLNCGIRGWECSVNHPKTTYKHLCTKKLLVVSPKYFCKWIGLIQVIPPKTRCWF